MIEGIEATIFHTMLNVTLKYAPGVINRVSSWNVANNQALGDERRWRQRERGEPLSFTSSSPPSNLTKTPKTTTLL